MDTKKVVLIGEGNTGKSSYTYALLGASCKRDYVPTLCVESYKYHVPALRIHCTLWDIAGSDRFNYFADGYMKEADGALVFYDATNKATMEKVDKWVQEFHRVCPGKPFIIVANKSDLNEEINKDHVAISCTNGTNIMKPLCKLIKKIK